MNTETIDCRKVESGKMEKPGDFTFDEQFNYIYIWLPGMVYPDALQIQRGRRAARASGAGTATWTNPPWHRAYMRPDNGTAGCERGVWFPADIAALLHAGCGAIARRLGNPF
jgi:hypothetical protein